MSVEAWGTGRRDYSSNVELSVIPVARSHQTRRNTTTVWDLTPYSFITIDKEDVYGRFVLYAPLIGNKDYVLYTASLTYDAHVLIKAAFGLVNTEEWIGYRFQEKYGYGSVTFKFPKGFIIYKELHPPWYPAVFFLPGGYYVTFSTSLMETQL